MGSFRSQKYCQAQGQSKIQVQNLSPKSKSKIQNQKSRGKGRGLGLKLKPWIIVDALRVQQRRREMQSKLRAKLSRRRAYCSATIEPRRGRMVRLATPGDIRHIQPYSVSSHRVCPRVEYCVLCATTFMLLCWRINCFTRGASESVSLDAHLFIIWAQLSEEDKLQSIIPSTFSID